MKQTLAWSHHLCARVSTGSSHSSGMQVTGCVKSSQLASVTWRNKNPDNPRLAVYTAQIRNKWKAAEFSSWKMPSLCIEHVLLCCINIPLNFIQPFISRTWSYRRRLSQDLQMLRRGNPGDLEGWRMLSINHHQNTFSSSMSVGEAQMLSTCRDEQSPCSRLIGSCSFVIFYGNEPCRHLALTDLVLP